MSSKHRTFGYCRISDKDQNEARQVSAMTKAGVDDRFILIDKQSGKDLIDDNIKF